MILTLPEPPSGNVYWRHARGRTYLSLVALQYRLAVLAICKKAKVKPITGPVVLTYHWWRGRKSGDLDNRGKVLLDALQGHAYTDDSQIVELHAYRHDRKGDSGITVTIEAAPQTTEK